MSYPILKIDLSSKSYAFEEIPSEIIEKYLGGRGLGAYLLYENVPAAADPLGEENHLIFTAGPASGTGAYWSSKVSLNTKSPLTGLYLVTNSSGTLAHQMRRAGLWALDICGISDSPTYIVIENEDVTFKDASQVWGLETAYAQEVMQSEVPLDGAASVSIGPAGEQLLPYAGVFCEGSLYRCFGRGGAGSVMGSKKLKGMLVKGDNPVEVGNKKQFDALKKRINQLLKSDFKPWAEYWRRFETGGDLEMLNKLGVIPTRNWQTSQFEGWRGIDKSNTPMGWPEKGSRGCGPYCPTAGCRDVHVKEGPYKGAHADVEWEAIYAFGATCGVDKMEAVIAANQICDEFGIDTISSGVTIGFAMECFERGLISIEDTDGIELRFGNDEALITMLRKMADQEGFGRKLTKGTRWLSEQIKGSESFAMHVKGLETGGYECRGLNGMALEFAINPRGACHHGYGNPARVETQDGTSLQIAEKGEYVKQLATRIIIRDSIPICIFSRVFDDDLLMEFASSLDGKTWSVEKMVEFGERVMCLERMFNMREGTTRKDDSLPSRLLHEPLPDGPDKGALVPLEELKDSFYEAMCYDLKTGNPSDAVIEKLGIEK